MKSFSLDLTAGPIWMLAGLVIVCALFAIWTYQHTVPRTTRGRRIVLITLRTLALVALLFAIFEPIARTSTTERITPSIALALDQSQSMQLPEHGFAIGAPGETRMTTMLKSVPQDVGAVLTDRTKLDAFTVGEHTIPFPNTRLIDSIHPSASVTDLSSLFTAIRDARKTKNTEAIVLYSDGAFTAGENPIYPAEQLGVPVYAVGLGDSTEPRDVAVTQLFTNEVATIGVAQPVDITLHYGGLKPGEHLTVDLFEESQKIGERVIEATQSSGDQAMSFSYTPTSEGIKKLSARVSGLPGEATEKNNLRLSYVRVLRNKFHVVLFAGAPSPDVSFIRQFFEGRPSYELTTFVQKEGAQFYEGPPTPDKLKQVDLVILVGFPIAQSSPESIALVRDLITKGGKSLLFIPSRQLDLTKLALLGDALPFRFDPRGASQNELKVGLATTPSAQDNPVMHIPAQERNTISWNDLAPLFKTETHFQARPESQTLANASVQGVKLDEPLIISRRIGNERQVALTGYGLWQWKLTTFGREEAYASTGVTPGSKDTSSVISALDLFLGNSMRWLTTQEENKRVRIEPSRKFYEAGERIDFYGQVYDESYQPIERADVTLRIAGGNLTKPLELALGATGNGRYTANLPNGLAKGDYTYTGSAVLNGKTIGTDDGRFNVGDFNIEFAEPRMRSDILRQMAARTGGKFYTPETAGNLMKDILASARFAPKTITNTRDFELWDSWPLLALSLLFFAAEWFMRKRLGML